MGMSGRANIERAYSRRGATYKTHIVSTAYGFEPIRNEEPRIDEAERQYSGQPISMFLSDLSREA